METIVGMTAIAVGIMLGLVFLKVSHVSQKWPTHCKLKCSC